MTDTPLDPDRCTVCQHLSPHRGTCADSVGRDTVGGQVVCGCDGREYGLAARLHFLEADVARLAHAGMSNARGGLRTAEALRVLADAGQVADGRLSGLRDAIGTITDSLADLNGRLNALEDRVHGRTQ